jgi:hypothetical protein
LLTLEWNAAPNADNWALARQAGVPIICHIVGDTSGNFEAMGKAGLMGPDNEYIHCTQLNETHWKMIADTGGKVSIAPAIEMQRRHGMPPLQTALDHAIQPSNDRGYFLDYARNVHPFSAPSSMNVRSPENRICSRS